MVINIDFFTKEELADLFSIACDCSTAIGTWEHEGETIQGEGRFLTEIVADVLYKGGTIDLVDGCAEDEDDRNGNYQETAIWHEYDDDEGSPEVMLYPVTLEDLKSRLQDAMSTDKYVTKLFLKAKGDLGDIDYCDAYNLMQVFMFGEVIYG